MTRPSRMSCKLPSPSNPLHCNNVGPLVRPSHVEFHQIPQNASKGSVIQAFRRLFLLMLCHTSPDLLRDALSATNHQRDQGTMMATRMPKLCRIINGEQGGSRRRWRALSSLVCCYTILHPDLLSHHQLPAQKRSTTNDLL